MEVKESKTDLLIDCEPITVVFINTASQPILHHAEECIKFYIYKIYSNI